MTGDSAHPEAKVSILRCPDECKSYWPDREELETALIEFTVQVYYDRVACLYQLSSYGGRDMVVVWNWRTGDVVKIIHPPSKGQYTDMSFLSMTSLLLCQLGGGACLNVVSWGLGSDGKKESSMRLQLPAINKNYIYTRIQHHSNPSPSPPPGFQEDVSLEPPRKRRKRCPIPSSRNFMASGKDRLLAFSTIIQKRTDFDFTHTSGHYYLFFLSERRLKAYLNSLSYTLVGPKEGIGTEADSPLLKWSEWGPQQVRWISSARTYGWAVCSRGMRFVCSPPLEFDLGFNSQVMMLDFQVPEEMEDGNRRCWDKTCSGSCCGGGGSQCQGSGEHSSTSSTRVCASPISTPRSSRRGSPMTGLAPLPFPSNSTLVRDRSILPNPHKVFEEEVVSTLPYLQVISEEWLTDSVGFMMDEESIVSVKVSEHEITALEVLRFTSTRSGGR